MTIVVRIDDGRGRIMPDVNWFISENIDTATGFLDNYEEYPYPLNQQIPLVSQRDGQLFDKIVLEYHIDRYARLDPVGFEYDPLPDGTYTAGLLMSYIYEFHHTPVSQLEGLPADHREVVKSYIADDPDQDFMIYQVKGAALWFEGLRLVDEFERDGERVGVYQILIGS